MKQVNKTREMAGIESKRAEMKEDRMYIANEGDAARTGPTKITLKRKRASVIEEMAPQFSRNEEMAGKGSDKFNVRAEKVRIEERDSEAEKDLKVKKTKKVKAGISKGGDTAVHRSRKKNAV